MEVSDVCKKVLMDKFENEEDFWDKFREAMRKLAARCRRVRHAKKTKTNREEAQAEMLSKRYNERVKKNGHYVAFSVSERTFHSTLMDNWDLKLSLWIMIRNQPILANYQ